MTVVPLGAGPSAQRGPRWGVIFASAVAVATLLGSTSVAFVYIGMNARGRSYSFERALLAGLPDWYFWAALAPLAFWLGEQVPFERGRRLRSGSVLVLGGIVLSLTELAAVTAFNRWAGVSSYHGPFVDVYFQMILQYFHFHLMIYSVIVAAAHAGRYYRSYRAQELEASRLGAELTEAHLAALQMQVQPHFLFNTLHTIATLVREGRGEDATDTLARLGELFRETLGQARRHQITLREELRLVEAYLDIERIRFADRLVVDVTIEPEALDARMPSMALQPLIENAIRHGIAKDPLARRVTVRAGRSEDQLRIEVRNEGPAYCANGRPAAGGGVGLNNVRARLQRLYGTRGQLRIESDHEWGAIAILELPFRMGDPALVEATS